MATKESGSEEKNQGAEKESSRLNKGSISYTGKKRGKDSAKSDKLQSQGYIENEECEKLAVEMILADSKRRKIRADQYGPSGWLASKSGRPNKRFLSSLVVQAVKERERNLAATQRKKDQSASNAETQNKVTRRDERK